MGFESVLDFTQVILYSLDLVRVVQEYHASIKELPTRYLFKEHGIYEVSE